MYSAIYVQYQVPDSMCVSSPLRIKQTRDLTQSPVLSDGNMVECWTLLSVGVECWTPDQKSVSYNLTGEVLVYATKLDWIKTKTRWCIGLSVVLAPKTALGMFQEE